MAQDDRKRIELRMPGVVMEQLPAERAVKGSRDQSADEPKIEEKLIPPSVIPVGGPKLYESKVDTADWLGTLLIDQQGLRCTATAIGPRVILTAAHCLERGTRLQIKVDSQAEAIGVDCTLHPGYYPYRRGKLFDYALCHTSEELPRFVTVRNELSLADLKDVLDHAEVLHLAQAIELRQKVVPLIKNSADVMPELLQLKLLAANGTLDVSKEYMLKLLEWIEKSRELYREVQVKLERLSIERADGVYRFRDPDARRLLLAGYGCTEARDQSGGNDGNLRWGFARISGFGSTWLAVGSEGRGDSSLLCAGDSGGPAFRVLGEKPDSTRRIVAINAYNLLTSGGAVRTPSYAAKTSNPAFVRFLRLWRYQMGNPLICGLDEVSGKRCRD